MTSIKDSYAVAYDPTTLKIRGRLDGIGQLFPGDGMLTLEADTPEELNEFIAVKGLYQVGEDLSATVETAES